MPFNHSGGTVIINNGKLIVNGDYTLKNPSSWYTTSVLKVVNENDYVCVNGDFYTNVATDQTSNLTSGVLEIKGNFEQYAPSSGSNFNCNTDHKVVLSSAEKQTIKFGNSEYSAFNVLELKNTSSDGIEFLTSSKINREFIQNDTKITNDDLKLSGLVLEKDLTLNSGVTQTAGIITLGNYDLTVNGDFTMTGGTLDLNAHVLTVN